MAASWHQGQARRSGDPYITHPLAVATILAETGADDEMLCAAMLHDTIEVELEALAYATMKRNRHARSASGRLLLAVAALLPAAIRIRWCEEWLGELYTLPARRDRVRFAISSGIPWRCGAHARLGPPAVRLMAHRLSRTEPLPAVGLPRHRAAVALDIERSTSRPDPVKAELRSTLYGVFDAALLEAGIRRQYRDRFIDHGDEHHRSSTRWTRPPRRPC